MALEAEAEALIGWKAQQEAEALAAALRAAADRLDGARARAQVRVEGVRGALDIDLTEMLEPCREARQALEKHGDALLALAALGGAPMGHLAEQIGVAETSVPNRLARTPLLRSFAVEGSAVPRVGLRGLKVARAQATELLQHERE